MAGTQAAAFAPAPATRGPLPLGKGIVAGVALLVMAAASLILPTGFAGAVAAMCAAVGLAAAAFLHAAWSERHRPPRLLLALALLAAMLLAAAGVNALLETWDPGNDLLRVSWSLVAAGTLGLWAWSAFFAAHRWDGAVLGYALTQGCLLLLLDEGTGGILLPFLLASLALLASLLLPLAARDRLLLLLPAAVLGTVEVGGLPEAWARVPALTVWLSFTAAAFVRVIASSESLPGKVPSSRAGTLAWYVGALAGAGLVALLLLGLVARDSPAEAGGDWPAPLAAVLVGLLATVFGLTRRDSLRGHAVAVGGLALVCLAGYVTGRPTAWLTLPGLVVPWAALAVRLEPQARIAMVPLQFVGMAPAFEALFPPPVPTNLMLALGAVHAVAVWATLPTENQWRGGLLAACAGVAGLLLLVDLVALATAPTAGRWSLAAICLAFLAAVAWLWKGRFRHATLPTFGLPSRAPGG